MVWHHSISRVFSCPLYLIDHTSVRLKTTNSSYRDRWLLPRALGRSARRALPRGTLLFQLGYGTHHWHSNSSSVYSRRHCLCDCHRTCLSHSSLLFVHFEVSVYYYTKHASQFWALHTLFNHNHMASLFNGCKRRITRRDKRLIILTQHMYSWLVRNNVPV